MLNLEGKVPEKIGFIVSPTLIKTQQDRQLHYRFQEVEEDDHGDAIAQNVVPGGQSIHELKESAKRTRPGTIPKSNVISHREKKENVRFSTLVTTAADPAGQVKYHQKTPKRKPRPHHCNIENDYENSPASAMKREVEALEERHIRCQTGVAAPNHVTSSGYNF